MRDIVNRGFFFSEMPVIILDSLLAVCEVFKLESVGVKVFTQKLMTSERGILRYLEVSVIQSVMTQVRMCSVTPLYEAA